ncbi:hypothetical protein GCM10027592_37780 [Spirosoma flavus]
MDKPNPFKLIEPTDPCPPRLKREIVSEIDLIRNAITVIDVFIGDLFSTASTLANPPHLHEKEEK